MNGLNHNSHPFMPVVVKKREMFVATQPLTFCEIFYVFKLESYLQKYSGSRQNLSRRSPGAKGLIMQ